MKDRVFREKIYHNKRFSKEIRQPTAKYYKITSKITSIFKQKIQNYSIDKKVLEIGCSKGYYTFDLAGIARQAIGIDISDVAIDIAIEDAKGRGILNVNFYVMDGSNPNFPDNYFDFIFGGAILHHLEFENALNSLSRLLKSDGVALFLEPLGYNPFINLYRKFTPKFRSPDETPLTNTELQKFSKYFHYVNFHYFYFTTLFAVPFYKFSFFNKIVDFFDSIDAFLFRFKFLRKFAWQVLIELKNPIK
jgi:SAM-dependent methyltransferase